MLDFKIKYYKVREDITKHMWEIMGMRQFSKSLDFGPLGIFLKNIGVNGNLRKDLEVFEDDYIQIKNQKTRNTGGMIIVKNMRSNRIILAFPSHLIEWIDSGVIIELPEYESFSIEYNLL